MNTERKPVDVPTLIASLAVIVRLHEGNRDEAITAMLQDADEARAAVAELIDKASRHIHAVDHPVNDGGDAARQARTLRELSAALARVGGA